MTQTQYTEHSKYNWLCNAIQLMNIQKVDWYPFEHEEFTYPVDIFSLEESTAKIYIEEPEGGVVLSSVSIAKGSVKEIAHIDEFGERLVDNVGSHDLRIHAFVIMNFKKFNGNVTFKSKGTVITEIEIA